MSLRGDVSDPLNPIFVVVFFCCSISQLRRARSWDLINFAGWHRQISFPGGSDSKESAFNTVEPGLISGSGRSPGEGNGNSLQYSCLENSIGRGVWWATVHGVAKSWTRLSNQTFTFRELLYNIVLISAVQQHESAISIPSRISIPPL